jgi:hypothetical protein
MTRIIATLAAAAALAGAAASAQAAELSLAGPAAMDKEGAIEITGAGFPAEAPVTLLFTTADGVESDITYALDPAPVADAEGNFATTWAYGRFVAKKLVAPGRFALMATDDSFAPLGETEVVFTE